MRNNFINKKIQHRFVHITSFILTVTSVIFIFVPISDNQKPYIGIFLLTILCIIFISLIVYSKILWRNSFYINQTKFTIKYGDLFKQKGIQVIAFNEFFDTVVDDELISSSTLNGQFINKYFSNPAELDACIASYLHDTHATEDLKRKVGKNRKYKLGTTVVVEKDQQKYMLVAFSKFDAENHAYVSFEDYLSCLVTFWLNVNKSYNGENLVIPLLGSGITRFSTGANSISHQSILEMLLLTFKYSNLSFSHNVHITIILPKSLKPQMDLFNIDIS